MSGIAYNTFADSQTEDINGLLADIRHAGFTGVGLFSGHARSLATAPQRAPPVGLELVGYFVEFVDPGDRRVDHQLDAAVQACRALGSPWLVVIPGPGWLRWSHWDRAIGRLLGDLASEVRVLLEPLSSRMAPVTCVHTVDAALRLLHGLPTERGGWVLDTAQLLVGPPPPMHAEALRRLAVVQLADLACADDHPDMRVTPGHGCLPIRELVSELTSRGYDGWWEAEVGQVDAQIPKRMAWLRSLHAAVSATVQM